MAPKFKFNEGEQVLCFHGPLLYEAKCLKTEIKDKAFKYMVHYNGWSKNWDEWVPESRILKLNDVGLQKQKELQKAHAIKNKGKSANKDKDKEKETITQSQAKDKEAVSDNNQKNRTSVATDKKISKDKDKEKVKDGDSRVSTPALPVESNKRGRVKGSTSDTSERSETVPPPPAPEQPLPHKKKRSLAKSTEASSIIPETTETTPITEGPKKKKAKLDPSVESEESYMAKIEIKVKLLEELKPWLVDDWDLVTKQKMIVKLPCKMNVEKILQEYIKYRTNNPKQSIDIDSLEEIGNGLRNYFNSMLGSQLLYKIERPQYSEILQNHSGQLLSSIYGATHLLRLFVKIGGMLAFTPLDEKSIQHLLVYLHDFLQYMSLTSNNLFSATDYMVAPLEHHRKAI